MSQTRKVLKTSTIPNTALRRLRSTPSYFFLIWRWSMWLYALIVITLFKPHYVAPSTTLSYANITTLLLAITFVQSLIVTLYAPIFRMLLPGLARRGQQTTQKPRQTQPAPPTDDDEPDIVLPLTPTRHAYWDIAIYGLDILICGLVMYFSAPFAAPPFGSGSPFYRYGLSTVFGAALTYRYRGGLAAAFGYDLFAILGMLVYAPGTEPHYPPPNVIDVVGSLIDAPVAALLTAFLASLIENYAQSIRREQQNARTQKSLVQIGETLMMSTRDKKELLQRSIQQIRQGGHLQRLALALIEQPGEEEEITGAQAEISLQLESTVLDEKLPAAQDEMLTQVLKSGTKLMTFEPPSADLQNSHGNARLYLPLPKDGPTQIILAAASCRTTPFDQSKEEFLTIAGTQLLIALENIRLTEQTVQFAASAERDRIAREIHDGISQLVYMMSLSAETCQTQAQRIAEATQEDAALITPLIGRLGKLVTVSKQALWETRNYMFSLKPLMSGTTTLIQMLTNQIQEFETISDLPVQVEISGHEELPGGERRRLRHYSRVGTALFRIVQEALTNAYKHANATQLHVHLSFNTESIEVEIRDNGQGIPVPPIGSANVHEKEPQRIYSGHGMGGMHARATELGGTFEVLSNSDGGITVRVCIPSNTLSYQRI